MRVAVLATALAACGGDFAGQPPDAPVATDGGSDASPACAVNVSFEPPMPYAFDGARVRAVAHVSNAPGVLAYTWEVKRNGTVIAYDSAAPDMSAVDFDASIAESYEATVMIGGTSELCPVTPFTVNVLVPGANSQQYRVRVYPPAAMPAPPNEKLVLVSGGANMSMGVFTVDPGVVVTGTTSARAYLRFAPVAAPDAYVEAFADAAGAFSVRVLNQPHDVLVVPLVPGLAPRRVAGWLPGTNLPLTAGTAITGVVRDPAGAPLAGAQVQLAIGGVPTTLATTDATGAFTVRASTLAGTATVEVTAPAASGLPRLIASSAVFDLAQPVQVAYDGGLAVRDLAGAVVRRGGVAQANAQVVVVGTLATAGTVTAGTTAGAAGEVRAHATANASGVLPVLRAPDELLSAVVALAPDDVTLSALDLRGAPPATVDVPALASHTVQLRNTSNVALPGAVLEARPKGALAMAGLGAVRVVADANGDALVALAPGAVYDLHYADPRGHEVGRLAGAITVEDQTAAGLPAAYNLPKAVELKGALALAGNPQPIGGAAVQILCATCAGTERLVPLAEGASSSAGAFAVPVADPGTMPP